MRPPSRRAAGLVLVALLLAAGCEKKSSVEGPVATGTILKNGAQYPLAKGDDLLLQFATVGPDGAPTGLSFRIDVDPATATFKTEGPTSEGIPAGKYKVRVKHINEKLGKSYLPAKWGTNETPLEVEVTDPPQPISIDLGRTPSAK